MNNAQQKLNQIQLNYHLKRKQTKLNETEEKKTNL